MTKKNLDVSNALRYMNEDSDMDREYQDNAKKVDDYINTNYDNDMITNATEDAISAFWESIAQSFPEISSGDQSPEVTHNFSAIAKQVVMQWLKDNA
jgi:hypothetical protein